MMSDRNDNLRRISRAFSARLNLVVLCAVLLLAVLLSLPGLGITAHAASRVADALHRSVMNMQPRYTQYYEQKALAGCFNWQRSTPDNPDVQYLAVSTALVRARGSVSVGRLASNALDRCHRVRRRNDAPCECQVIDRNGRNVLDPPEDFVRRF